MATNDHVVRLVGFVLGFDSDRVVLRDDANADFFGLVANKVEAETEVTATIGMVENRVAEADVLWHRLWTQGMVVKKAKIGKKISKKMCRISWNLLVAFVVSVLKWVIEAGMWPGPR